MGQEGRDPGREGENFITIAAPTIFSCTPLWCENQPAGNLGRFLLPSYLGAHLCSSNPHNFGCVYH